MRLLAVIGLNSGCGLGPCAAADREAVGGISGDGDGHGIRGVTFTGRYIWAVSD